MGDALDTTAYSLPDVFDSQAESIRRAFDPETGEIRQPTYAYTRPYPDINDFEACMAYAAKISAFESKADERIADVIGETIYLSHVFVHEVRLQDDDEEGGYKRALRVVLEDEDGRTYEGVTDGILDSLRTLFSLPGIGHPSTWKRPIPVKVTQVATAGGRRVFKLTVDFGALTAKASKKSK